MAYEKEQSVALARAAQARAKGTPEVAEAWEFAAEAWDENMTGLASRWEMEAGVRERAIEARTGSKRQDPKNRIVHTREAAIAKGRASEARTADRPVEANAWEHAAKAWVADRLAEAKAWERAAEAQAVVELAEAKVWERAAKAWAAGKDKEASAWESTVEALMQGKAKAAEAWGNAALAWERAYDEETKARDLERIAQEMMTVDMYEGVASSGDDLWEFAADRYYEDDSVSGALAAEEWSGPEGQWPV